MTINEEILNVMHNSTGQDKDMAKYVISLFQRASKSKDKAVSDEEAIKILRPLRKDFVDNEQYYYPDTLKANLEFIDRFIPRQASEDEIREFLKTVDFSSLKSKMQAIGLVKDHFDGNVDGDTVKSIVENEF